MPRCKLPDCPIEKDGRCLEGRGEDCPNLVLASAETEEARPSKTGGKTRSGTQLPRMEKLYSGLPLELVEAQEFSRGSRAVVITMVGDREAGKTSLIARFHQMFQNGRIGNLRFAGSRTLPRFEELNWLATLESGAGTPLMERSSQHFDNSFLHLRVRGQGPDSDLVDILLNDISGETFGDAVASQDVCNRLITLARCDHLIIVLDGGALLKATDRHDHQAKTRNFLQRIIQSGQIGPRTALHLIVSKMDLVHTSPERDKVLEIITTFELQLENEFASRVGAYKAWRMAARPTDGSQPTVDVISALFCYCVATSLRYPQAELNSSKTSLPARDFVAFRMG
jgi:hypothetical protein